MMNMSLEDVKGIHSFGPLVIAQQVTNPRRHKKLLLSRANLTQLVQCSHAQQGGYSAAQQSGLVNQCLAFSTC